jgi:hypothetical protein
MHCPAAPHAPPEQTSGAAQTVPHAPQLFESELRLVQTVVPVAGSAQPVSPIVHCPGARHVPPEQDCDGGQTVPQAPQLFESVLRLVQTAVPVAGSMQLLSPMAHCPGLRQAPLEQDSGAGQTLPHAPQLFESALRLVQTGLAAVPHVVSPGQLPPATHLAEVHDSFAGHTLPHAPQLLESVLRLVQTGAAAEPQVV